MRFVMFYHSLVSDWNHGNAHFLRGVVSELLARGHAVTVYEPEDGWSRRNLLEAHGTTPLEAFAAHYPGLRSELYDVRTLDLDRALAGADVVIVHEWNEPALVSAVGAHHARQGDDYRLLFHDTHHRVVSDPEALDRLDLTPFDGVLAFGRVLADHYRANRFQGRVFVWHEAADTRVFYPHPSHLPQASTEAPLDLVWIGNWGDDERAAELQEFLIEPVRALGLTAEVWGVRYPEHALAALARAGIRYRGWLPNFEVPAAFGRAKVTIHVPRRPYAEALAGIPTIRPFEAMACGVPLISAPWRDTEGLFQAGSDYLVANDGEEMTAHLRSLLLHPERRGAQAQAALATIEKRHTCRHRVDELLDILKELRAPALGHDRSNRDAMEATAA